MNRKHVPAGSLLAVLLVAIVPGLPGQSAPAPAGSIVDEEEVVVLSPFTVEASEDSDGYQARSTLAGTRVRTDLRDVASAIQVITNQQLIDLGAVDNSTLLQYTTNTEVGGVFGNFSGTGGGFLYNEDGNLLRPQNNTRVRGLDAADNTRDYFLTEIPWDGYIVDRVDLQRGPNSILFGVGSPAGIINTSVNTASFQNFQSLETRFGSFGSLRASLDVNYELIDDVLALRVAALGDRERFRQDPAYENDRRIFAALRYRPNLFGKNAQTDIRVNFETGSVDANRPRTLPPVDAITPWFTGMNKSYYNLATQNKGNAPNNANPWLANAAVGRQFWNDVTAYYGDANNSAPSVLRQTGPTGLNGIGTNGQIDQNIGGLPQGFAFGVASYSSFAQHANSGVTGGSFYSDRSLADESIFNFYELLIDGDNKYEWQDWHSMNVAFSQTLWDNQLGFELVYDGQRYADGQRVFIGNSDTYKIGVELNSVLHDGTFNGGDSINNATGAAGADGIGDNVGRAYVANSDEQANSHNEIDRDGLRFTTTAEFNAAKFMGESTLSRILGRHVFTGLLAEDSKRSRTRNWATSAATTDFPTYLGMNTSLTAHFRSYNYVAYLSPSLMGRSSAAGAELDRVRINIKAPSEGLVRIFDNHWNGGAVNPAATAAPSETATAGYVQAPHVLTDGTITMRWFDPAGYYAAGHSPADAAAAFAALSPANQANASAVIAIQPYSYLSQNAANPLVQANLNFAAQSENPANYLGWVNRPVTFLNADEGDEDALTYNTQKTRNVINSQAFTWQGYLWDGLVVPVYGWRRDRVLNIAGNGVPDPATGIAPREFGYRPESRRVAEGDSTSYGVVVHMPESWADKLPGETRLSLFYNNSENFKADAPRGDHFGNVIENPVGKTEEYGVVVSLSDKYSIKANWYETEVANATLTGGGLGQNGYFLWAMPAWGTAFVVNADQGIKGNNDNNSWAWNYAASDDATAPSFRNPDNTLNPAWQNHASTVALKAAIDDWRNIPLEQSFFNAYGNEVALIQVDAIRAGNWTAADPIWGQKFDNQPISGGLLAGFGSSPVMTVDTVSKGVELELTAQPVKNWNVTFNFAKTFATRQRLAPTIESYILAMQDFFAGPAGDIRLWGSASNPLRSEWQNNVINPYNTLLAQQGSNAPEISPYRFNFISTYNFVEGRMKGWGIGGAFRWEDARVLGYEYSTAIGAIDVDRPLKGDADQHVDLWVRHNRKFGEKLDWTIQLNLRNVGESKGLEPVTINPDGSVGYSRIVEGMTFQVTNSFKF